MAQSAGAHEVLRREVGALRADLRDREAQSAGLAREVDQLKEALKEKTEEAESRGAAMEQQGKRLLGQLQR